MSGRSNLHYWIYWRDNYLLSVGLVVAAVSVLSIMIFISSMPRETALSSLQFLISACITSGIILWYFGSYRPYKHTKITRIATDMYIYTNIEKDESIKDAKLRARNEIKKVCKENGFGYKFSEQTISD